MSFLCWPTVCDAVPAIKQHCVNASYLPGHHKAWGTSCTSYCPGDTNIVTTDAQLHNYNIPIVRLWLSTPLVNTKYLYSICTMLAQRRRRLADVVQVVYKCFVFAGLQLPTICLVRCSSILELITWPCWGTPVVYRDIYFRDSTFLKMAKTMSSYRGC